jgi:hypothetical protein
MTITTETLERIQLDLETAHGHVMGGFLDSAVSEDAKIVAAAIALAGSQIALAIAGEPTRAT